MLRAAAAGGGPCASSGAVYAAPAPLVTAAGSPGGERGGQGRVRWWGEAGPRCARAVGGWGDVVRPGAAVGWEGEDGVAGGRQ